MNDPNPDKLVVIEGIPICTRRHSVPNFQSNQKSTYHRALGGCVPPRLVVTRENTHVAAAHKLLIVQTQNRVVRIQKLGVEHNLDAIRRTVKQMDSSNLHQDRVGSVIGHVVSRHWRKRVALQGKDAALESNLVLFGEQVLEFRELRPSTTLKVKL